MKKKRINLALQGGGAHGAFTWGLLDKLLEEDCFTIEGLSATSAGSMNAVILTQGMLNGGPKGARQLLYDFWHSMSEMGARLNVTAKYPIDIFFEPLLQAPVTFWLFNKLTSIYSPYQFNPTNFHPIREVLLPLVDFEALKHQSMIKLFVCATNIKTGKIKIFNNEALSMEAVLASACLPQLFQAVEVEGEFYWDGGYLGNPAIFPLIYDTKSVDILILHTVPIVRDDVPKTKPDIDHRLREISFNSSLMREMRAIAFVSHLINDQWIKPEHAKKLKLLNLHCIRADKSLHDYPLSSVYTPDWDFLLELRDLGREQAEIWLKDHYDAVGKKTTIDYNEWL